MTRTRVALLAGLGIVIVLVASTTSRAGSKNTLGIQWTASQQISMDRVDHAPWDTLLQKYVDLQGMVNYAAWNESAADQRALDSYLASLSRATTDQRAKRKAQLAYWINAYNAVTVRGILREYPTTSIRNHTAKAIGYNIWDDLLLQVGDQKVSLNDIEHKVLRNMHEPRIHFAIVCASIGCPRLLNRAYQPHALDEQLTVNSRSFFSDPGKFRYDARAGRIDVSPIMKWFGDDFGATTAERLATIAPYLPDAAVQDLARSGSARVTYLDYDWNLNDQAARPATAQRRR